VISLLTRLGFTINYQKSILTPAQRLIYLGILIDSQNMTFEIPQQKAEELVKLCNGTSLKKSISVRELSSIIGKLVATMPAISMAKIQVRYLQRVLREALQRRFSYGSMINLDQESKLELKWWSQNLILRKGCPISVFPPDLLIQSDAAKTGGWGAHCQGQKTGGQWTPEERLLHIDEQEMIAANLAIRTFAKWKKTRSIHLQVDNTSCLAYIANQGGTRSLNLLRRAKEIWNFLTERDIQISLEWLPSKLNVEADLESRTVADSSEWLLCPAIFKRVTKVLGLPESRSVCIPDLSPVRS